eukprot:m.243170 g.243170  ORF g.243170 m.243170 type:complete len:62 (+) comp15339_c0_seq2:864-1049(+)
MKYTLQSSRSTCFAGTMSNHTGVEIQVGSIPQSQVVCVDTYSLVDLQQVLDASLCYDIVSH